MSAAARTSALSLKSRGWRTVAPECPEIRLQRNALIPSLLKILFWGRYLIVRVCTVPARVQHGRDEADGGGFGGLDQPAAGACAQGLENKIIQPDFESAEEGEVNCRERLGGLLRYHYRDAA